MTVDVDSLLNSALLALQADEFTQCKELTTQALNQLSIGDDRRARALSVRGAARINSDVNQGLADMCESVRLAPHDLHIQLALGQAFMSLYRVLGSRSASVQSRSAQHAHPDMVATFCKCLLELKRPFLARQILSRSVEAKRANPELIRVFAESLHKCGDIYGARDILGHLHGDAGPQNDQDRLQLARLDMALREFGSAQSIISQILKSDPASIKHECWR